jgi:cytochrome P450
MGAGDALTSFLSRPPVVRAGSAVLRSIAPVLHLKNRVFVFRHADVETVLERPDLFSVVPIYAAKMKRTTGDFILGMDDTPTYAREAAALRKAVRPGDVDSMRRLARTEIERALAPVVGTGRLDVVAQLTRVVATRLLGTFWGTPGPDESTMMRWMRTIFWHLFGNLNDVPDVRARAEASADEMRPYLDGLVAERRAAVSYGRRPGEDFLSRLVALGDLDDDGVRRGIGGIIVGAVETVSKASVLALEEILRRPTVVAEASALAIAGDVDAVGRYAFEALRFNPHHPAIVRRAVKDTTLGGKAIHADADVYAVTLSATFDPAAVDRPDAFMPGRPQHAYFHFSAGMHKCFGRSFAAMLVAEMVAAVLRLTRVERARGNDEAMVMEGPLPDHFFVQFEPTPRRHAT